MNDRGHLSAFTLDQLLLSSLPDSEAEKARAHLEACPACRGLLTEMEADQQRFAQFVLPRTMPALQERASSSSWLARLAALARVGLPVAAAAGAALAIALVVVRTGPEDPGAQLGIKGGPVLQVFAARGPSVFAVKEGSRLKPGDRIRFVVEKGAGDAFVLVASLDGAGKLSIYYPTDAEQSAPLAAGRVELPGSVQLDDTLGAEHLFAFFSARPLLADEVKKALATWPQPPQLDARLVALSFQKEAP
jgi:hypothetical protein